MERHLVGGGRKVAVEKSRRKERGDIERKRKEPERVGGLGGAQGRHALIRGVEAAGANW